MPNAKRLPLDDVRSLLVSGSRTVDASGDAPPDVLVAEMLRESLCTLTTSVQGASREPAYVTRFTNSVRRRLSAVWKEAALPDPSGAVDVVDAAPASEDWRDMTRRVLGWLEDIGDAVHCGDGYWLPAPTRFVALPSGRVLIVGGLSTAVLRDCLGLDVRLSGFARSARRGPPDTDERWCPFGRWRGPIPDLGSFTKATLAQGRTHLRQSAAEFVDFEVYAPNLKRDSLQYYRWTSPDGFRFAPTGVQLCRSRSVSGRVYFLGRLGAVRGRVTLEAESPPVAVDQVRRLLYGLDLAAGVPTSVTIERTEGAYRLTLRNALPKEENRVLVALAAAMTGIGRPPLRCVVAEEFFPETRTLLEGLGIRVVDAKQGE